MPSQITDRQAFYEARLAEGMSPKLAEMLACQAPPMSNTDREFLEGLPAASHMTTWHREVARSMGINPDSHVYLSGLADGRGPHDPEAWVSGRGDIERVCNKRGYGCSGIVDIKGRDHQVEAAPSEYKVADSIVEGYVADIVASNPEVAPTARERRDLKEKVGQTLAGAPVPKGRNPLEAA